MLVVKGLLGSTDLYNCQLLLHDMAMAAISKTGTILEKILWYVYFSLALK